MINGTGTDIIEVERIREKIDKLGARFLERIYTQKEQEYCLKHSDPAPYFAARFAAKEAAAKALGTGFRGGLQWTDIEVTNDLLGKPLIHLSENGRSLFDSPHLHLSLSHCKNYAVAMVIWEESF